MVQKTLFESVVRALALCLGELPKPNTIYAQATNTKNLFASHQTYFSLGFG
jgi:hypothetical protein